MVSLVLKLLLFKWQFLTFQGLKMARKNNSSFVNLLADVWGAITITHGNLESVKKTPCRLQNNYST